MWIVFKNVNLQNTKNIHSIYIKKECACMGGYVYIKNYYERKHNCSPSFAREVSETTRGREHNESNINVTKNGEFISLLNESISSFGEGDLPICIVFYSLNLEFNTSHF